MIIRKLFYEESILNELWREDIWKNYEKMMFLINYCTDFIIYWSWCA